MRKYALVVLAILVASLFPVLNIESKVFTTIANQIADHTMAKAVEPSSPYDPIVRATTFFTLDDAAYSWIKFVNVTSPDHVVVWNWIGPNGASASWNTTIPDPGEGNVWTSYVVYAKILIRGYAAENETGNWQVEIHSDGALVATDAFSIISPPWGVVASQLAGPGYPAGISVDPETDTVYTINSADEETVTFNGQPITTYCIRIFDGETGTQLDRIPILHSGTNLGPNLFPLYNPTGISTVNYLNETLVYLWGGQLWAFTPNSPGFSPVDMGPDEGWATHVVVDSNTGHIFIAHESGNGQNVITALGQIPSTLAPNVSPFTDPTTGCLIYMGLDYVGDALAVNRLTSKVYAVGNRAIFVIDESTYAVTEIPLSASLTSGYTGIAVNPVTNMIYVHTANLVFDVLEVINGTDNSIVATLTDTYNGIGDGAIAVNPATNRIYIDDWASSLPRVTVIDGYTNTVIGSLLTPPAPGLIEDALAVNPTTGKVYLIGTNMTGNFVIVLNDAPGPKGVVINEVESNPLGFQNGDAKQWVELYNQGPADVDIGDWTLTPCHGGYYSQGFGEISAGSISDGLTVSIPSGTVIPAEGYYVFETPSQADCSWLSPSNDTLLLRDAAGRLVDWTPFLSDPASQGSAETWQRMPNGQDTPAISDWSFITSTHGSPNGIVSKSLLTITVTTGGSTDPAPGNYTYDYSTNATVTATATHGFSLANWLLNENDVGNQNPITITMNADYTLQPIFESQGEITLTIVPASRGTTNPSDGNYTQATGTTLNVNAISNDGYAFNYWLLDGANAGSANPTTVTFDSDHTLQPVFVSLNQSSRTVGVNRGDWARYDMSLSFSGSTIPQGVPSFFSEVANVKGTITDVSGTTVTISLVAQFKNGTETTIGQLTLDVATGQNNGNGFSAVVVASQLDQGDLVYTSQSSLDSAQIGDIARWTQNGFDRMAVHLKSDTLGEYYWDRDTGLLLYAQVPIYAQGSTPVGTETLTLAGTDRFGGGSTDFSLGPISIPTVTLIQILVCLVVLFVAIIGLVYILRKRHKNTNESQAPTSKKTVKQEEPAVTQAPSSPTPGAVAKSFLFCPNCGESLPTNPPKFCPFCGFDLHSKGDNK
jgi:hypothetical protein